MADAAHDYTAIDQLVQRFFAVFDNRGGQRPAFETLDEIFVPHGLVTNASVDPPQVMDLAAFVQPRIALLTDGTLTDFFEEEIHHTTTIFGRAAERRSAYRKAGVRAGVPFAARGAKAFQFARTPDGWRIVSVIWDDER